MFLGKSYANERFTLGRDYQDPVMVVLWDLVSFSATFFYEKYSKFFFKNSLLYCCCTIWEPF